MPVLFTESRGILWGPQGDHIPPVLKTLQRLISLPVKAKVLTKMCHLSVSISSHSPHCSFHSSHNSFAIPWKFLPCSCLRVFALAAPSTYTAFSPDSCMLHYLSLSSLFSNVFKCEFPDHRMWKNSPPQDAPRLLPWLYLFFFYSTALPKWNILHDLLIHSVPCLYQD